MNKKQKISTISMNTNWNVYVFIFVTYKLNKIFTLSMGDLKENVEFFNKILFW